MDHGKCERSPLATTLRGVLGEGALAQAQDTYLNYLESAAAVFELDGTPAYSERRSEYCALLYRATRHLTSYLGGESDPPRPWCGRCSAAAREAMRAGRAASAECPGGLLLHAVPILAFGAVVGAAGAALGAPPRESGRLEDVAESYCLPATLVRAVAESYSPRPAQIVAAARDQIEAAAQALGRLYESLVGPVPRRSAAAAGRCGEGEALSTPPPGAAAGAGALIVAAIDEPVCEVEVGLSHGQPAITWARLACLARQASASDRAPTLRA